MLAGAGEIAEQLNAPDALPDDPGSVSGTHMAAYNNL